MQVHLLPAHCCIPRHNGWQLDQPVCQAIDSQARFVGLARKQSIGVGSKTCILAAGMCRYKANMELAQPSVFGKGAGCDLLKDSCDAYTRRNPAQNFYCPAERKDGEGHEGVAFLFGMIVSVKHKAFSVADGLSDKISD